MARVMHACNPDAMAAEAEEIRALTAVDCPLRDSILEGYAWIVADMRIAPEWLLIEAEHLRHPDLPAGFRRLGDKIAEIAARRLTPKT